jgi:hypothetical protein
VTGPRDRLHGALFGALATGLPPLSPPDDLRARLMRALDGPARYLPFCSDLAAAFDIPAAEMKSLLLAIDEPGRWTTGIEPIQGFLHFRPGSRHQGLHGGFVRMHRGMLFPLHRHRQRELTYVLEGALIDDGGVRKGPGSAFDMAAGSAHSLAVSGEGDALVALLHGGIEMLGT